MSIFQGINRSSGQKVHTKDYKMIFSTKTIGKFLQEHQKLRISKIRKYLLTQELIRIFFRNNRLNKKNKLNLAISFLNSDFNF